MRFAACVVAFLMTGCTYFVNTTAQHLAKARLKAAHQVHVSIANAGDVIECFKRPGGQCGAKGYDSSGIQPLSIAGLEELSRPADDGRNQPLTAQERALTKAHVVLNHEITKQIVNLFNALEQAPAAGSSKDGKPLAGGRSAVPEVTIDLEQLSNFSDLLNDGIEAGAFDALADRAQRLSRGEDDKRRAAFIRDYLHAYFRNGKFFTVNAKANDEDLENLKKDLAKELPGATDEAIAKLIKALGEKYGDRTFGVIGSDGFVARDGTQFQIPALTAQLVIGTKASATLSDIDGSRIGADLVRVYFEALFDSHDQLPAVSNATGVSIAGVPLPKQADTKIIDDEAFAAVQQRANGADAAASATFGRIVRGASWISLNNEAVAKLLETVVGVTVRKVAEKAAWCWYACNPKSDKHPAWEVTMQGGTEEQTVTVHVQ